MARRRGEIEFHRHDRDWFAVELEAGRFYSIALKGSWTGDNTLYDPVLRAIYDTDGNRVASAGGHWGGDRIATFAPVDGGTYYVEAGGGGDDEGTYTLSVTDVTHRISDDFEAGTGTTGRVEVGGSATGEIDYIGDRDWFAVELMAGNTYRFDQEHPPNVLYDPILRGIHDADGNFIAGTKDSSGSLGDSRVFFTPEDTGTYYVAAGAAPDTTGSYTLSVINYSSVGDDYAAGTDTTGAVAVGGSATGRINYADDRDWFAVDARGGQVLPDRHEGLDERPRHLVRTEADRHPRCCGRSHPRHVGQGRRRRRVPQQPGDLHGDERRHLLRGSRR